METDLQNPPVVPLDCYGLPDVTKPITLLRAVNTVRNVLQLHAEGGRKLKRVDARNLMLLIDALTGGLSDGSFGFYALEQRYFPRSFPDNSGAAEDADDDMDARIRARVEVEVASERARLLAQHAATCNCRKAQPPGAGSDP